MVTKQDNFALRAQTALLSAGPGGKRLSIAALARELGYTREAVSAAIHRGLNPGVRRAVAKRLEVRLT